MAEPLIITASPRSDHQLDVTIELGPERTQAAVERAARLVSKKARIPGFRPGKAPIPYILRTFGREAVLSEIIEELSDEVISEALETGNFDVYGRPTLEDIKFDPIQFKLVLPLPPTVELGDYSAIRVEAPEVVVSEADVDVLLEEARQDYMVLQEVDRPAALGDTVIVDIKGTVGDTVIVDNQDWELILRGENGWLPGFDEAFVGLAAGDHKEFTLRYPEDSASRFKGQEVAFSVTVKAVKTKVLPEVNDEFVRSLGNYADLADYRAKKLEEIRQQREAEAEAKLYEAALEALIAQATLAYPKAAVEEVVEEMMQEAESRSRERGYSLLDLLRLQGRTVDGYRAELRPVAEKRLKARLVLTEFARREGITVSADEEQAEVDSVLGRINEADERQALSDLLSSEAARMFIRRDLLTSKAYARLKAVVTGQVPAAAAAAAETVVAEAEAQEVAAEAGATASGAAEISGAEAQEAAATASGAAEVSGAEAQEAAAEEPAAGDEAAK